MAAAATRTETMMRISVTADVDIRKMTIGRLRLTRVAAERPGRSRLLSVPLGRSQIEEMERARAGVQRPSAAE